MKRFVQFIVRQPLLFLHYISWLLVTIPILPMLFLQGKKIRKTAVRLPEAKNPQGISCLDQKHTQQMLFLGESTFAGVGVETHQEGFPGAFATALSSITGENYHWTVYAKSGYTVSRIRQKLLPQVIEKEIDIIIIGVGGNDAFHLISPFVWLQDIRLLIIDLRHRFPGSKIFFTQIPPIRDFPAFTPLIRNRIGSLAELLGKVLVIAIEGCASVWYLNEIISINKWLSDKSVTEGNQDFFADGIHPSKFGYQLWAIEMASFVAGKLK